MPYLQRENGLVYIYTYLGSGRSKPLLRHKTRHLDPLSDEMVKAWIHAEFETKPKPKQTLEPFINKNSRATLDRKSVRTLPSNVRLKEVIDGHKSNDVTAKSISAS